MKSLCTFLSGSDFKPAANGRSGALLKHLVAKLKCETFTQLFRGLQDLLDVTESQADRKSRLDSAL